MNAKSRAYSENIESGALTGGPLPSFVRGSHEVVDSLLHPRATLIRQVLTRSGRQELGLILIDDEENILQALDAGVEVHSLYHAGAQGVSRDVLRRLPAGAGVFEMAQRTCKKVFANEKISRLFALAHTPAPQCLDHLQSLRRDLVVLEDLTISGNIGAIVRTALAFGAGGVILLNAQPVDLYDRRLIRASRGHIFALRVLTATTGEFIRWCNERELPLLVMEAQAQARAHEVAGLTRPLAIVFGNEKDGCSEALRRAAAIQIQIPMDPRVDSLNVSTAAGIMLYGRTWFNIPETG